MKSVTKGHILRFQLYKIPKRVQLVRTESRMWLPVTREVEGGEMGNNYLVGMEFQFGKMNMFWRWMAVMVAQ